MKALAILRGADHKEALSKSYETLEKVAEDDPLKRQPDITLAKKLLNWSPKVSRKEGMKMTFNYFQNLSDEKLTKIDHKDFSKHIKQ